MQVRIMWFIDTLQSELFCSCLPLSLGWNLQVFGTAQAGEPIFIKEATQMPRNHWDSLWPEFSSGFLLNLFLWRKVDAT